MLYINTFISGWGVGLYLLIAWLLDLDIIDVLLMFS